MIKKKKTMYEILEVYPNATDSEIKAAYQRMSQKLQSERNEFNREDTDFKLQVLNVAYQTLSFPMSRDAYDAQITAPQEPLSNSVPSQAVVLHPGADVMAYKAEAMSLKAEAMSLKAEAMSLKLIATPQQYEDTHDSPLKQIFASLASPLKKILTVFGTLIAIGMVIQVVFMLFLNRSGVVPSAEAVKAEEKIIIQDYYQRTGVRAASRAEVELFEAESRRVEVENRRIENEQREAALAQRRESEETRRFVEESRRLGDKVSAEFERAEEVARYQEERKNQELAEEKRREEEAEALRIERERERWRSL